MKVEPRPGLLSGFTRPPRASTTSRTIPDTLDAPGERLAPLVEIYGR